MAANATLALKAGACVRRVRFVIVAPDPRHSRRSQAGFPLNELSEFGRPPLTDLAVSRPIMVMLTVGGSSFAGSHDPQCGTSMPLGPSTPSLSGVADGAIASHVVSVSQQRRKSH